MSRTGMKMRKTSLPITGMTCASCAATIEKALSAKAGVYKASVNLATGKASVEYDPNRVTIRTLINTISEAGYGVATEKTTAKIGGVTRASCVAHVEKALAETTGVISANVRASDIVVISNTLQYLYSFH